jgi:hypothetical protein
MEEQVYLCYARLVGLQKVGGNVGGVPKVHLQERKVRPESCKLTHRRVVGSTL